MCKEPTSEISHYWPLALRSQQMANMRNRKNIDQLSACLMFGISDFQLQLFVQICLDINLNDVPAYMFQFLILK